MTVDYVKYRESPLERERVRDLLSVLPRGRSTVLDIGCRDGYLERLLVERFDWVTALDLARPEIDHSRVIPVQGDVTDLRFADNSFDVVCCLEVLEHIPPARLRKACTEIARVARHEAVIGVPYRQDLRIGRTTCRRCGAKNPPWAHVNQFDERRLRDLFAGMECAGFTYVGESRNKTNRLAALLMDWGGNPWGSYNQEEPCIRCGAALEAPSRRSTAGRACAAAAARINRAHARLAKPSAIWIHAVFRKK